MTSSGGEMLQSVLSWSLGGYVGGPTARQTATRMAPVAGRRLHVTLEVSLIHPCQPILRFTWYKVMQCLLLLCASTVIATLLKSLADKTSAYESLLFVLKLCPHLPAAPKLFRAWGMSFTTREVQHLLLILGQSLDSSPA